MFDACINKVRPKAFKNKVIKQIRKGEKHINSAANIRAMLM